MTRAERLALLGPEIVAAMDACEDAAPDPASDLVAKLRRIMISPAGGIPSPRPEPAETHIAAVPA
ncbi:hypothetical protein ABZ490_51485 [Streptomyces sp. NPDC005811]|uniref:hypothetical protein n=1 Tax=Streptomyces sp. NPDC005811 TaxID=3154565 RepID=UPI0033F64D60